MDSTTLPENVRGFLREHVETYEQLEILLILHEQAPRKWRAAELVKELGIGEECAIAAVDHLQHAGLVRLEQGKCSLVPRTPSMARAIEDLARTYASSRFSVVQVVSSHALERVRSAAIRMFAEAFRVRDRNNDG